MGKRLLPALGAAALVTATSGSVYAAKTARSHGGGDHSVDRQAFSWQTSDLMYNSTKWRSVDWSRQGSTSVSGGDVLNVLATGPITVTVSGTFAGGPLDVRVTDNGHVMRPGPAHFVPVKRGTSFSFTFVRPGGHPLCGRNVRVQVRPSTATAAVLKRADIVVTYRLDRSHDGQTGCV